MLKILSYILMVILSPFYCYTFSTDTIPVDLEADFTLNGQIPVTYGLNDEDKSRINFYPTELFNRNIKRAVKRECLYFGDTDLYLYQALDDLKESIDKKKVAIIGSQDAWYESIVLAYGGIPVVIDSRSIYTNDQRVTYCTIEEFLRNPYQFDLVLNLLNTSSEGLGVDGQSLNSMGDVELMNFCRQLLTSKGKLILAIPVGPDQLIWNIKRIYGEIRLKMLLKNWRVKKYYGFTSENIFFGVEYQPILIIENKLMWEE